MQKIPKTTAFPFILTLISRISYTRFIFFPFARNLILQSRIYLCKVDFTFSIHLRFPIRNGRYRSYTYMIGKLAAIIKINIKISPYRFAVSNGMILKNVIEHKFHTIPNTIVCVPIIVIVFCPINTSNLDFIFFDKPITQ